MVGRTCALRDAHQKRETSERVTPEHRKVDTRSDGFEGAYALRLRAEVHALSMRRQMRCGKRMFVMVT